MIVGKHMSAPPITISPDTDFKIAMDLMQQHRIRRLPVVDAGGALAGIVAERDLQAAADRYLQSLADVGEIMTRKVVTVDQSTPVVEAASLMIGLKIGGLPVVDGSNRVLGIITETDLLEALVGMLAEQPSGLVASARKSSGRKVASAARKRPPKKRPAKRQPAQKRSAKKHEARKRPSAKPKKRQRKAH